jgi:hypothetical protein
MALPESLLERVGGCHADLYAPTNDRRIDRAPRRDDEYSLYFEERQRRGRAQIVRED